MTDEDLIDQAYKVTGKYRSSEDCTSGSVGAALVTKAGSVYTGVNIDCSCSLGFCAEHSAIAEVEAQGVGNRHDSGGEYQEADSCTLRKMPGTDLSGQQSQH